MLFNAMLIKFLLKRVSGGQEFIKKKYMIVVPSKKNACLFYLFFKNYYCKKFRGEKL